MSPEQVGRELERTAARLQGAAARGIERAQVVVMVEAVRQSSGTTSSAQLRRAGHPFATRHGSPQAALLPINRQSGLFAASWEQEPVTTEGDEVRGAVINTAPYAPFLAGGTRTTFARPLPAAVIAATEPEVRAILAAEIGKVI